jgi:predicted ATPase
VSFTSLGFQNYKCFAAHQQVDLSPVTVLLGKNNSGKSALSRLPLVMSAGLKGQSATPIDLQAIGTEVAGSFVDLVNGRRAHGSLTFDATYASERPLRFSVVVQNVDEYQLQVVRELAIEAGGRRLALEWDYGDPRRAHRVYQCRVGDEEPVYQPVPFSGLLPETSNPNDYVRPFPPEIVEAIEEVRRGCDNLVYLGPFRDQPLRTYRLPSATPTDVGVTGGNAPAIIASDLIRGSGEILEVVNAALRPIVGNWRLEIERQGTAFELLLRSEADSTITVNLADTGAGVAQVLPVVVQHALNARQGPDGPTLHVVEQPELHLHPSAHAALADIYLSGISKNSRFLIETHSETFLLRLRRRIAEGLSKDILGIYYLEQTEAGVDALKISVDEYGNVDFWPENVFSENYGEAKAIAHSQLQRRHDAR